MHRLQSFVQANPELSILIGIGIVASLTIIGLVYSVEFRRHFFIALVVTAALVWAVLHFSPLAPVNPAPSAAPPPPAAAPSGQMQGERI